MMMYKVIYQFLDLQDDNHVYDVGDKYPRDGYEPTLARIKELASKDNKIGKVLIIEEQKPKKNQPKKKATKKAEPKLEVEPETAEADDE